MVISGGPAHGSSGFSLVVQQVLLPGSRRESWTLLGADGVPVEPVEPVERHLTFLTDVDRSPNTVKAYAHVLKDSFVFLAGRALDWQEVRLEDVGEFVAWLRLPHAARNGRVAVLPSVTALRRGDGEPEAVGGQRPSISTQPATASICGIC